VPGSASRHSISSAWGSESLPGSSCLAQDLIQANYNVVHKHTWSANKTAFLLPKSQTIYDFFYDVIRRTEKNKKKSCGREGKETKVTISAASFQLAHVILMMQKSVSAMI